MRYEFTILRYGSYKTTVPDAKYRARLANR